MNSNPAHSGVYSIQLYVSQRLASLVTYVRSVLFSRYSADKSDCHNITEIFLTKSGIKHHNPNSIKQK